MGIRSFIAAVAALGALLAAQGASAQQQTWKVSGGDIAVSLLRSLMNDIGIPLQKVDSTAKPTIEMEQAFGLAVSKQSNLVIEADYGVVRRFAGGTVRFDGGFTLGNGRRTAQFNNPVLETNGSDPELGFRLTSGQISFDLRHAQVVVNPYTRQLTVGYADVLISQSTARALGRPDLAGQLIGSVSVTANLELISGTIDPPRFFSDGGDGEDNPNPVDCQLFAMSGLTSLGRVGTFPNGRNGLSMSTTSCNVGQNYIFWFAPMDKRHPVIAMNLYRIHNDRFEHIGLSWLKHGFLSTNSNGCGQCQQPPLGGSQLGLNCSDTYGTGNNGDRQWLGERKEVNPFLGTWECRRSWFSNYVDDCVRRNGSSSVSDPVSHRLEVKDSDLGISDANYYYEAYYVVENEVDKYNNIGYRRATTSWTGSQWSFSTVTNLVRDPAIKVWDPNAQIATPRTEGDVWVGIRVINLGGGNYRYLYALYVHDLDRQIREFAVPILAGANVTNIAFRDVDDVGANNWTSSYSNGMVKWSTETFAQNPEANSLKYSTVFNFEFEADVAPGGSPGTVMLGQFKPGTVPYLLRAGVSAPLAGVVGPDSFQILFGVGQSGGQLDLLDADGAYLVVREAPPLALGLPSSHVQFTGTASIENPSGLKLSMRTSTSATPAGAVTQRTWAFDYVANAWELVDTRAASSSDQTAEINLSNPARFIQPGTRQIRARVAMYDPGTLFSFGWVMRVDQVTWTITR